MFNGGAMEIKFFNGYWTVFVGKQAVLACVSLESALAAIES